MSRFEHLTDIQYRAKQCQDMAAWHFARALWHNERRWWVDAAEHRAAASTYYANSRALLGMEE